ncbi:hypothetical protein [Bradyrhizobium erythrophlei]|uniref:Uncharacterized protein n=1 Tax=Bradyrhizobium erythrophlei TaxID=1437360 RepID=A0A1M5H1U1_9BRAD|nr:hypothetical protein [Bradyrhizobium erythrophlei]SHG09947.1 hypothetical protein SAMN05443248_0280 [Bradyrhizobium erythrophlei]
MWVEFWTWLGGLPASSSSFVGSLTGAAFGLLAIIIGALFNAFLNRWRDDRLRRIEAQTLAIALKAELTGARKTLIENADDLERGVENDFQMPDMISSIRILPEMLPKLGLLGHDAVAQIMTAYGVLERYAEHCIRMGGSLVDTPGPKKLISLPGSNAARVARMNRVMAGVLDGALAELGRCI